MVMSQQELLKVAWKSQGVGSPILDTVLDHDIPLEIVRIVNGQEMLLWSQVFSKKPPVVVGNFPIDANSFKFYWNSKAALETNGTFPSKLRLPSDPVILLSNASSVKNHTVKDGWLQINSGGGNGRIYLELYEIPEFKTLPQFKRNLVLMATFKPSPNNANFSIKYGNHGTTGFLYNGKRFMGGFGQHYGFTKFGQKIEGNHNGETANAKGKDWSYPNNLELEAGKEYTVFSTYISNPASNEMQEDSWLKQDDKWLHVLDWNVKKDSEWDKLMKQLPNNGLDTKEALAGPAMIDLYHVWMRANKATVSVKDIFLGTIN
jgi:hypothetical protein